MKPRWASAQTNEEHAPVDSSGGGRIQKKKKIRCLAPHSPLGKKKGTDNTPRATKMRRSQACAQGTTPSPPSVEPDFLPDRWNAPDARPFNNCYAYALDDWDPKRTTKPQPGERSGTPIIPTEDFTCAKLQRNILADYPGTVFLPENPAAESAQCPCDHYKVFMALDPTPGNKDYHFWRQDSTGNWSHKPGDLEATRYDGSGHLIVNPRTANRSVGEFSYSHPCFFMCVPRQHRPPAARGMNRRR
jgi:hypothetical protein